MVNIQREGEYNVKGYERPFKAIAPRWGTVKDSRGKVLGYMMFGQFQEET